MYLFIYLLTNYFKNLRLIILRVCRHQIRFSKHFSSRNRRLNRLWGMLQRERLGNMDQYQVEYFGLLFSLKGFFDNKEILLK